MPKSTRAQQKVDKIATKGATLLVNNNDDNKRNINDSNGVSQNSETDNFKPESVSDSIAIPPPKQSINRRSKSPITSNKRPTSTSLSRSTSATAYRPTSNSATRQGANSKRHFKSKGTVQTQTVLEPPDDA